MFKRLLRQNVNQQRKQGAAADPEAPRRAGPVGSERAVADKEASEPLDREQVVQLIGKHARKLADLAIEQGCMTLYYFLQSAAEQAERELAAAREDGGSSVS